MAKVTFKTVYNDGSFEGIVVKCVCGAIYRTSNAMFEREDMEETEDNRIGPVWKCVFCGKELGAFDQIVFWKNPALWFRVKRFWGRFKKFLIFRVRIKIKSFPLTVLFYYERSIKWIKGCLCQSLSFLIRLAKYEITLPRNVQNGWRVVKKFAWSKLQVILKR